MRLDSKGDRYHYDRTLGLGRHTTLERLQGAGQLGAAAFIGALVFNAPLWAAGALGVSGMIAGAMNGRLGSRPKY